MKISQPTIDFLVGLITGDTKKSDYKKGSQLVTFFNTLGESDEYDPSFPSRKDYVLQKILKFNGTDRLKEIINQAFHPGNYTDYKTLYSEVISESNDIFAYEGLKLVKTEKGFKICELSNTEQVIDTENSFFKKDTFNLFISHRDTDKKYANELKKSLEIFGISSFVAHDDIEPSAEWQDEIVKALFSMDSLLALLTSGFSSSIWTNQEIGFAYGRGVFILSIKAGEEPKGFVGKFQALRPKSNKMSDLAIQIAEHLIKNKKTSEKMKSAYIHALSNTESYSETEKWALLLPHIDSLSEEQGLKLLENYNSNSQAYDSFSLNGEGYNNKKNIADYLNEWVHNKRYTLQKEKLKEVSNDH
jgi:hypothetical protein